jgi:hypothetical protein
VPKKGSKSSAEREIELLQQQLSLKDAVIESKDAVIEAKDKLLAQRPDVGSADTTALAQRLAAAEARLQQLEAASDSAELPDRAQKRARHALDYSLPLEKDEILDEIFYLVGRKEWLYVGGVCRRWRGRYLSMCYKARADKEEHVYQTSHRSSFVTAARFSLAVDSGLQMPDASDVAKFFENLPVYSQQPIEVLTLARVHGAAWHEDMCLDAAYYGNSELLKWLHKSGCPWVKLDVAVNNIRGKRGQRELILPWLLSAVGQWSQQDKNELLCEAGGMHNFPALNLMLAEGAEWPSSYVGEHMDDGKRTRACWRFQAVAWALSKGYSWGAWRCQDLAPELYTDDANRADAINLFEWAHKNGCPCTCEAAAADGAVVAA